MYSFIAALIILVCGYFLYGRLIEKIFGPDDRDTPAYAVGDGVDCVPVKIAMIMLIIYIIQLYQWRIADDEYRDNWEAI